jgi:bifunctional non-homologous end joining protein LigD
VIGGWTDPKGSRTGIGSLLLGVHDDDGKLRYAGNVGTGFNERTLRDLRHRLDGISRAPQPVRRRRHGTAARRALGPARTGCEVSFGEMDARRQGAPLGVPRPADDKPAEASSREEAVHVHAGGRTPQVAKPARRSPSAAPAAAAPAPAALPAGLRVSNPERVIDR